MPGLCMVLYRKRHSIATMYIRRITTLAFSVAALVAVLQPTAHHWSKTHKYAAREKEAEPAGDIDTGKGGGALKVRHCWCLLVERALG